MISVNQRWRATKRTQARTRSRHNNLLCCHNYYRCAYSRFRYFLGYSQHYRRSRSNGPPIMLGNWTFRRSSWRLLLGPFRNGSKNFAARRRRRQIRIWKSSKRACGASMALPARSMQHSKLMIRKIACAIFSELPLASHSMLPCAIFCVL